MVWVFISDRCLISVSDYSGRVPSHHSILRHVSGYYRAGPHDGSFSDAHAAKNGDTGTYGSALLHVSFHTVPIRIGLQRAIRVGCPGKLIVDESDIMPHKYII